MPSILYGDKMTETEYVINGFEAKFHTFKGKKIVLHGSREYAEKIIDHFYSEYHFIGVMSNDPIEGNTFRGLKVLSEENIPQTDIDMIILTERVKYAEAVYASIGEVCRNQGILLYNMYGLNEQIVHDEIETCVYRNTREWEELCSPYDIIAFEVVDTLTIITATKWYEQEGEIDYIFQELIPKLFAEGKDIRLSLRKSCPEEKQIEILRKSGLFNDLDSILIRREGEDLSFRTLAENNPDKKILYIGSGLVNECILPRCYGIDTYRYVAPFFGCLAPEPLSEYIRIGYIENLKEQVTDTILDAEVVSFDIFDTIIQRKTLEPRDVFYLVEKQAKVKGLPADNFAQLRTETERSHDLPNIYEIYDALKARYGWNNEEKQTILNMELSVEHKVIVPRTEVVELLRFAIDQGKIVVLTSDMYLPEPLLRNILTDNGIEGYMKLFVSCDVGKSKYNGLYEELLSLCNDKEKILHIGNDIQADGKCCDQFGIRRIILPSSLALAYTGKWRDSIRCAESLMERCLIGMTISELFRDPFRNPNTQEVSPDERLRRFALGVTGPLVTGYMTWLIKMLRENEIDKVLFFSRDGYMPERIYRSIQLNPPLPESVYFYANRHAAFLTCADDETQTEQIASVGRWSGMKGIDILKNVYSLDDDDILLSPEWETIEKLISRNMPKISENAAIARKGYITYAKKCGMKEGEKCAVVDFIAAGSTQMYLEMILPINFIGFYFGNYEKDKSDKCEIKEYLKGDNPTLLLNYIELESFFSAPEPSVECIAPDGSVVFQQEVRSDQEIEDLKFVLNRSEEFAKRFFELFYEEGEVIRPVLPEEMFAADGYHWVQKTAYEDFFKRKIKTRKWRDGNSQA